MKKLLITFLCLSLSTTAFTQVDKASLLSLTSDSSTGGLGDLGSGSTLLGAGTETRPRLNLDMLTTNSALCSFNNELSPDDRDLLRTAKSAISALRNNEQCRTATAAQSDAFDRSISSFQDYRDATRPANFATAATANCSNYERFYDLKYEQFVNTWKTEGSSGDIFRECRGADSNEQAAIECATRIVSQNRVSMESRCQSSREYISSQEGNALTVAGMQSGMTAIQAMLNNSDCIDHDGSQRMSLVQSAIGLAGRAASLNMVGSIGAIGIGAITNLLQSAVGSLFKGSDPFERLQNQENFEKVACLYEQIENRSKRCERDAAEQYVIRDRSNAARAQSCAQQTENAIVPMRTVRDIDQMIRQLNPQAGRGRAADGENAGAAPSAPAVSFENRFNGLMENMLRPTSAFSGNSDETPMSVGLQSAQEVVSNLDNILSSNDNVAAYLRQKNPGQQTISVPALNTEKARLRDERSRANSLLTLLTTMNQVGTNPNQTPEDLTSVENALKSFNGGRLNEVEASFSGAFNQMMSLRAEMSDDRGLQIRQWRNNLNLHQVSESTVNRYNQQIQNSRAPMDDAGVFEQQRNVIRPSLRRLMDSELNRLSVMASRVTVSGAVRDGGRNERQTLGESILWPMIRACNQLQSVGSSSRACEKLSCPDGRGVKMMPRNISQNPNSAEYTTFICKNKGSGQAAGIRVELQDEFENRGTVCGQPLNSLFR